MKKILDIIWTMICGIVRACVKAACRVMKKDYSESAFAALMQFVKFGIVGVSNTIISYVIYLISYGIFQTAGLFPGKSYYAAQVVAYILSVLWSFYWNNKMVFTRKEGEKRSIWKALVKTYVSYSITGLFLSTALLHVWIEMLGISAVIAPLINLIITVPLNFLLNKFWAFKEK